jgi:hypothetical protein
MLLTAGLAEFIGMIIGGVAIIYVVSFLFGIIGKFLNKSQIMFSTYSSIITGMTMFIGFILLAVNADKIPNGSSALGYTVQSVSCLISTWIVVKIHKKFTKKVL